MRPASSPSKILPPGVCLPPLVTADTAKGPTTRPTGCKGGKRHARRRGKRDSRFVGPCGINPFLDDVQRTLKPSTALVWVNLWRDTKPGGLARAGATDLARRIGVGVSTVKRGLRILRARGLVEVVHQGGVGRGVSTYRLRAN